MKANELRINNFVRYSEEQIDFKVVEISEKGISVVNVSEETWIELDQFEPIKLTEEWLLKFGFKPLVKDWQIKGLILHTRNRGFVVNKKIPIVKYVHQLQNLYFALTGEELQLR